MNESNNLKCHALLIVINRMRLCAMSYDNKFQQLKCRNLLNLNHSFDLNDSL